MLLQLSHLHKLHITSQHVGTSSHHMHLVHLVIIKTIEHLLSRLPIATGVQVHWVTSKPSLRTAATISQVDVANPETQEKR